MRWLKSEYILKGVYLGVVLYAALQAAATPDPDSWYALLWVNIAGLAGLRWRSARPGSQMREGYAIKGRFLPFLLFLLLESPLLIYAGIIGGTLCGVFVTLRQDMSEILAAMLVGGAVLGVIFDALRQVRLKSLRLGLMLLLAIGLVAGMLVVFNKLDYLQEEFQQLRDFVKNPTVFGVQLLIGLPFFYLLTFAGQEEESEIEIGAMCARSPSPFPCYSANRAGCQPRWPGAASARAFSATSCRC